MRERRRTQTPAPAEPPGVRAEAIWREAAGFAETRAGLCEAQAVRVRDLGDKQAQREAARVLRELASGFRLMALRDRRALVDFNDRTPVSPPSPEVIRRSRR